MIKSNKFNLLIWVVALQLIGFLIGFLFSGSTDIWYIHLVKSPLTPPGYIFPIAWTLLYVMIAMAGWMIWQDKNYLRVKNKALLNQTKIYFLLQLVSNWLWTPLFFYFHLTLSSLILIGIIILSTTMVIMKQIKLEYLITILLMPYLLWSLFAFYLNLYIWLYN